MRWLEPISAANPRSVRSLTPDTAMWSAAAASKRSLAVIVTLRLCCTVWYMYHMVQKISVDAISAAPPATVYELLRDPTTWSAWSSMDVTPDRPGTDDAYGVGSTRKQV